MPVPVPGQGGLPDSGARDCPAFLCSGSSLLLLLSLYRETPLGQRVGWTKPHTEGGDNLYLKACLASPGLGSFVSFLPSSHTGLLLLVS